MKKQNPITLEGIATMAKELRATVKSVKGSSQATLKKSDYESGISRPEAFRPAPIVYGCF